MLYISTRENNYLVGGVNYDEDAAKEKQWRRKRKYSVLIVIYGPAEVICLSANIPRNLKLTEYLGMKGNCHSMTCGCQQAANLVCLMHGICESSSKINGHACYL